MCTWEAGLVPYCSRLQLLSAAVQLPSLSVRRCYLRLAIIGSPDILLKVLTS